MAKRPDDTRTSKFLSLVLRHDPARIGIHLDANGWTPVSVLMSAMADHGYRITPAELARIVEQDTKGRYALRFPPHHDDIRYADIRANQGHTVPVDLQLEPRQPPAVLYHGTPTRNVPSILSDGLNPGQRHAVHLCTDVDTARAVGARRGDYVVLAVDSGAMNTAGHRFYLSANHVWLTDAVPARYIHVHEQQHHERPAR